MSAWLDASHRTPRLVLAWPAIAGWSDEAAYSFEAVLEPRSLARRIVVAYLGEDALGSITAAVRAARRRDGEEPATEVRSWARTIGRGFCPGDLDEVEVVTVREDGVRGEGYSHSYCDRSGEWSWFVSRADFVRAECACRASCADILPRIDGYLAVCAAHRG